MYLIAYFIKYWITGRRHETNILSHEPFHWFSLPPVEIITVVSWVEQNQLQIVRNHKSSSTNCTDKNEWWIFTFTNMNKSHTHTRPPFVSGPVPPQLYLFNLVRTAIFSSHTTSGEKFKWPHLEANKWFSIGSRHTKKLYKIRCNCMFGKKRSPSIDALTVWPSTSWAVSITQLKLCVSSKVIFRSNFLSNIAI